MLAILCQDGMCEIVLRFNLLYQPLKKRIILGNDLGERRDSGCVVCGLRRNGTAAWSPSEHRSALDPLVFLVLFCESLAPADPDESVRPSNGLILLLQNAPEVQISQKDGFFLSCFSGLFDLFHNGIRRAMP